MAASNHAVQEEEEKVESELYKALEQESNNSKAPESYRIVLSKVVADIKQLSEQSELDRIEMEKISTKNSQYCEYVKAAEKNYEYLAELYKNEHKLNLDQQERILELEIKLKQLEDTQLLREQRVKQQVEQMQLVHSDKLARQREEFTKSANKQALGRKNIEDQLIIKDNELMEIKKKVQDMEARLIQLENQRIEKTKETEHFKVTICVYI
ncbi:hypothetical protein INT48_009435 [Thamnidium elegans]|uniref:Uncharacterized protein n=1 Tax=Thamnidium elegans TaxID=101142 RepID=A0A8H7VT70_9FUNG|nr:hypothetical protein INT48_009435 [Thamnidium elegans]